MDELDKYDPQSMVFDIVLGLVCPIGSNVKSLTMAIKKIGNELEHTVETITVSNAFDINSDGISDFERVKSKLQAGTEIRRNAGKEILANFAMKQIRSSRKNSKQIFVIKSLKHPDEIQYLKKIYGKSFFLLGAYQSPSERLKHMEEHWKLDHREIRELNDSALKVQRFGVRQRT